MRSLLGSRCSSLFRLPIRHFPTMRFKSHSRRSSGSRRAPRGVRSPTRSDHRAFSSWSFDRAPSRVCGDWQRIMSNHRPPESVNVILALVNSLADPAMMVLPMALRQRAGGEIRPQAETDTAAVWPTRTTWSGPSAPRRRGRLIQGQPRHLYRALANGVASRNGI